MKFTKKQIQKQETKDFKSLLKTLDNPKQTKALKKWINTHYKLFAFYQSK